MKWQPIETAPKDGTWVLLIGGKTDEDDGSYKKARVNKARPVVAFYVEGRIYWDGPNLIYQDEPYWAFSFWNGDWRSGYDNPTHWMPLPTPPTA